jgi:hypothetical protein
MNSPITNKQMQLITEARTFTFKGVSIEINYKCYLCKDSGEKFTTVILDYYNLQEVKSKYKKQTHAPTP